jgi:hypothetical protein
MPKVPAPIQTDGDIAVNSQRCRRHLPSAEHSTALPANGLKNHQRE